MRWSGRIAAGGAAVLAVVATGVSPGWWVKGHESITEAAAARLPDDVPAFFRAAGKELAHFAGDPDRWKNPAATFSRDAVAPDHFLDLEDLDGKSLPRAGRYAGVKLVAGLGRDPSKVGTLPYAILEGYDKLSCAFYDYRRDPKNPAIPMKCLVYAGNLAHYTTDAAMPLHTTRDYDGRVQKDGSKLQKGIHAKLDAFPEKFGLTPEEICRGLEPSKVGDVWERVRAFLAASHAEIDRCYAFDKAGAFAEPTPECRAFVLDRCRAGAQLTLDVWLAAWRRSAELPPHY